jgi:O-antigen ligase
MKIKWYNFGLYLSLSLTLFLVPLVFAPQLNTSFEFIKVPVFRSLVWIGVFFFVMKVFSEGRLNWPDFKGQKLLWIAIFGYFFVMLLATIFSSAPALSFWGAYFRLQGFYTILHYLLFFLLLVFGISDTKTLKRMLFLAVFTSFLVSVNGLLQYFVPNYMNFWNIDKFLGRVFSTMGHPNYLGTYLIMILPLNFVMFLKDHGWKQYFYAAFFFASAVALILTFGRASLLGIMAGGLFFALIYTHRKGYKKLFWASLVVPLIGILALVTVNVFPSSEAVNDNAFLSRLVLSGENVRSIETRLTMWPAVLKQVADKPLIGYGPDSFSNNFIKYAPEKLLHVEDLNSRADRAHNTFLDLLVVGGILGLLAYFGVLISVFVVGLRSRNDTVLGLLSGLLALLVANQFGFSMVTHYIYFWFFVAGILLLSFESRNSLKVPSNIVLRLFATFVTVGLCSFLIFSHNAKLVKADYYFRKGFTDLYAKGVFEMMTDYKLACELNPYQDYYHFAAANLAMELKAFEVAEVYLEKAGEFNNFNHIYHFDLARLNAVTGKDFDTEFEKATELAPTYHYAYLEWGKAFLQVSEYERAAEKLEKYLSLVPGYWKWKPDLDSRSFEEQEKYRIFYKINPFFDEVFEYLSESYGGIGNKEMAEYYLGFAPPS